MLENTSLFPDNPRACSLYLKLKAQCAPLAFQGLSCCEFHWNFICGFNFRQSKNVISGRFIGLEGINYQSFIIPVGTMDHFSPYYNSFQTIRGIQDLQNWKFDASLTESYTTGKFHQNFTCDFDFRLVENRKLCTRVPYLPRHV